MIIIGGTKIMDFEVVDSNSVNEYVEANNSETIKNKIDSSDVLVVPAKHTDGEYYFAQESVDFIKFCRLLLSIKRDDNSLFFS